jgi:signal transduction histidine kinase
VKLRTDSLRFRFIASTFLWIVVSLVLTGFMVAALFRIYTTQQFHDELQVHIVELEGLTSVNASGQPYLVRRLSDPRFIDPGSGFYWEVRRDGYIPVRSTSLGTKNLSGALAKTEKERWAVTEGPTGKTLEYGMIRQVKSGGPPICFSIASDVRLFDDIVTEFAWPLAEALAGFAVLMLAMGAIQIAYGLRPFKRVAASVAEIRAGRQAAMIGDYPSEIRPLADDLNALLATNTAIVKRGRLQAANLAHGLRTPLAIMLDEASRLAERGETESAAALSQECEKMRRQINYHLARARAAAPLPVAGQGAIVDEIVTPITTALRRLHAEKNINISCSGPANLTAACDPIDLGEMISNLIDNACKWAKSAVDVTWSATDDQARIFVEDDGVGIPIADRDKVFAIGERLDAQVEGSGLGLAITRDLARLYHGTVELGDANGGGLRIVLSLPRC